MNLGIYDKDDIDALAQTIRRNLGSNNKYTVKEMADEIDTIQVYAYDEGRSDGRSQGLEEGRTEGIEQGKNEAYEEIQEINEELEQVLRGTDIGGKSYYDELVDIAKSIVDRTITEYTVPEGTTRIGPYALAFCTSLTKLTIPEGLTQLSTQALPGTNIAELVLPMSCESIGQYAINNGFSLRSVVFGDTKSIGPQALSLNSKCLTYDFSRCTTVPTLNNVNAFQGINANAKIYVPAALYDEWIVATNWSQLASYIVAKE